MQQPFEVWVSLMLSVRYSDLAHVTWNKWELSRACWGCPYAVTLVELPGTGWRISTRYSLQPIIHELPRVLCENPARPGSVVLLFKALQPTSVHSPDHSPRGELITALPLWFLGRTTWQRNRGKVDHRSTGLKVLRPESKLTKTVSTRHVAFLMLCTLRTQF